MFFQYLWPTVLFFAQSVASEHFSACDFLGGFLQQSQQKLSWISPKFLKSECPLEGKSELWPAICFFTKHLCSLEINTDITRVFMTMAKLKGLYAMFLQVIVLVEYRLG
jgi:hypothetical protein